MFMQDSLAYRGKSSNLFFNHRVTHLPSIITAGSVVTRDWEQHRESRSHLCASVSKQCNSYRYKNRESEGRDVHKTLSHKTETFHIFKLPRPRRDRDVPKTFRDCIETETFKAETTSLGNVMQYVPSITLGVNLLPALIKRREEIRTSSLSSRLNSTLTGALWWMK